MNEVFIKEKCFYNVKDIQSVLGVGRSRVYDYLKEVYTKGEPFKVIKIGSLYKIPKNSFNKWIERISE